MSEFTPSTSDRRPGALARDLIAAMRRRSTEHLQSVLARVFARADDWLFDLAKKDGAPTGSPYLHAMRALRNSRAPIERGFRDQLDKGFEQLDQRAAPKLAGEGDGNVVLALLDESELEEQLATNLTAEAIMRVHGNLLDELAGRLARMLGVAQLEAAQNPLSAHSLANAIGEAHRGIDVPADVRMVLFKYYEREVIHDLRELLVDLNGRLAAAGFSPVTAAPKPAQAAQPQTGSVGHHPEMVAPRTADGYAPAASDYAPMGANAPSSEDRAVFDALVQMLHAWRPGGGGSQQLGGRQTGRGGQRPMVAEEMMSVLSLMQNNVPAAVSEALERPEVSLAALLKNELLRGASRIGLPPEQVSMSQDDEDAVDLVGMLFDVMFDERDFEHSARTMISRLVVPFVKAAVMDRRLFLYKTHPARRLLNSLAEAVEGNRGEGPQERELLQKAENTVDRLIAEFNEDIAIFETLEQELRSFLDQHRRRVELAERRAAEAQRGQERLEQARDLASKELEQRTQGLQPTPAMEDFLGRCWTHHLSMIALREGPESSSWQSALSVADSLLALLPRNGEPAKPAGPALQALREPIENVLASSGIIGEAAQEMQRALADSLERLARGQAPAPAPSTIIPPENVVAMPERRNPAAAAAAVLADLKPRLEVVAGKAKLEVNEDDVELMRQLKIGTWIHIAGEDGKHHPVKLSWVSPISSRLMFVNRRGVRVLVASVEELAAMKQEGNLLVREQEGVFDQVLHRVMGKLRDEVG
ncbi:DUF1631 family protein [Arenimonas terrae]|uniref:DUF1631 domain-containing protein n=1 Tax=Arenimonas terrae TaxID=2546226 RepID=A0A5C4RR75_9GAMM|nr:DUF1631 family protein [Arenimonas terrae]TNJ33538.1 DUF1631 domain-containing protein [Arenimonas terrae]